MGCFKDRGSRFSERQQNLTFFSAWQPLLIEWMKLTWDLFKMSNQNPSLSEDLKKKVRFADISGRQLVFVKTITPCNSLEDLQQESYNSIHPQLKRRHGSHCLSKHLFSRFSPPLYDENFTERLKKQKVCLESVDASSSMITGIVAVENLAFQKEIQVRYTLNKWWSFQDIWADYVPFSRSGDTDKFCFRIVLPLDLEVGQQVEFAIRYRACNKEFWDNNLGKNYVIEVLHDFPPFNVFIDKDC